MRVKMNQLVRWDEGIIKTPRQMVNEKLGYIREYVNFNGKRRAVLVETQWGCVEVSGKVVCQ